MKTVPIDSTQSKAICETADHFGFKTRLRHAKPMKLQYNSNPLHNRGDVQKDSGSHCAWEIEWKYHWCCGKGISASLTTNQSQMKWRIAPLRLNQSSIYLFFDCTSNPGIVGHANSTDPIVGSRCHFSCTSRSMPEEKAEWESEKHVLMKRPCKCHSVHIRPQVACLSNNGCS